ncbi:hypothetical protein Har1130_11870 [Haloarcula sp. CBA1130]|uniref:DUF7847 domain-containing protein n=1 Tax=unclassified Haloarcula TaxID=2624677 RepID=UPI001245A169|nr:MULTISPECIES: hypothetical protein [unclassified Haloarcula]KAA9398898.1 hypothetical protein Har1129_11970 [Haloarcula sp. CBA1129]KAA9403412.1 hypothetical protein Har1130_11870 [Haloarcula sp. CBA1130]
MALQIGRAFQDGIDELLSERGAVFAGVFIVYGLLSSVVWASLSKAFTELFLGQLPSDAQVNQAAMAGGTPLALDLPIAVAAVGALVLFVVNEALNIVAIRAFASDDRAPIPDNVGRRLGKTVAVAIVAGIFTTIAVGIGLVLLIIPGLVFALLFFFVRQEIALNDSGIIESISNSVGIVTDNLLATFVLAIVLAVLGIVLGGAFSLLPISLPPMVLTTVSTVLSSVVGVFSIAVTTVAYLQATESGYTQETESIGGL